MPRKNQNSKLFKLLLCLSPNRFKTKLINSSMILKMRAKRKKKAPKRKNQKKKSRMRKMTFFPCLTIVTPI